MPAAKSTKPQVKTVRSTTTEVSSNEVTRERRARRSSGGITLSDVAKVAGVSAITASRALNTPDRVSPDALARVRGAIERTGYVPNMLAGGLASNRSRLVAALVPTIAGPVFLESIQALTEALAESGYQLMLGQSGYSGSREDALLDAIIGRRPDGIVLTGVMHSAEGRRRLLASGIPVVETWDLTPTPIDMLVGFSHEKVGAAVAEYLYARGKRRPAIVTGDDQRAGIRHRSFVDAAVRLGIAAVPACVVPAPTTLGSGRSALAELLQKHPDIDAVFCSSDVLALGVMTEAQSRGLSIPEKFAVFGFGDLSFAGDTHPPLTTVRIDGTAIGRQAAKFIVERAQGAQPAQHVVDLGFTIVERQSV
ncbi:MAG: LacI family DNA-binding transcriptional regulator [Betaproteobacteria bacterium]|nr:LacI family DNA-binding transcriptional regulator [Betaproteobacteria bacterium]